MNDDDFNELLEQRIESSGLQSIIASLAEICRNRGNVSREDGRMRAGRLWTHRGAILFNTADDVGSTDD